ncbi:MAG: site-specific integrase [Chlamydiae bacterium]|nr:site-specific integrase [Chlamydiota bacterium]
MTMIPALIEPSLEFSLETYQQAKPSQASLIWKKLDEIKLEEALCQWLSTLAQKTQINYRSGIRKLIEFGLLNPMMTLEAFALTNHEVIIDQIKLIQTWAESSRQARAACYISFTGFLNRHLQGVVKKALPIKKGSSKTFFRIGLKVKTQAMTQLQWLMFFKELEKINPRDCLIGKVILQGGKRVNEVLSLQIHQIDWEKCEITFPQSKIKGVYKETVITYSDSIMKRLQGYIEHRTGPVFITRFRKPVMLNQVAVTFAKAGKKAGIPFKITPHVLRASTVTYLKQQGFQDSDIMRVTGHVTSEMVYAYDKSPYSDNPSKKVNLIS